MKFLAIRFHKQNLILHYHELIDVLLFVVIQVDYFMIWILVILMSFHDANIRLFWT